MELDQLQTDRGSKAIKKGIVLSTWKGVQNEQGLPRDWTRKKGVFDEPQYGVRQAHR
ncbi:hypothetical protein BDZ89DRAFT_1062293 [Hymenopellis radicata]|nr:hypothetical protein BDZ89DRAFT_1062293 [Hymenopellis radicata]